MKPLIYFVLGFVALWSTITAQEKILLYPNGPKDSNGITEAETLQRADFVTKISEPRMYFYPALKEKASGAAVLICPGGGYSGVSVVKEGEEIAKWFNDLGVTAFVLYYRMPNGHSKIPLEDAQTALKIIKNSAQKWNLDKNKIGIMGFSAGGHLASTVGTHFKSTLQRPDFMILAYPVVTMNKDSTHMGSRVNLIGKNPTEKMVKLYSNELQVTKNTPPTFIVHAIDDKTVPIFNSKQLLKALKDKGVPAELHTFEVGGHGFGMRTRGIPVDYWPDLLKEWLKKRDLIQSK
ncbi:MAG TPA: alpha/beta hydrolase [Paludibacter sp.]